MKIPLTRPLFTAQEEKAVAQVLRSGWVTQGPKVAEFEAAVADFVGVKYAIATTSATTALFLSLKLLDIGPGDEVIVPSFTFIATANVIFHVGAKPIFADIDSQTYNIDPVKIKKAITHKTKAILPVDQVGLPCDLDSIYALAKQHKLYVVEDAACALGSEYKGKRIGSFGDLVCLSFHPRKAVTTGEGGMILTNNKKWAESLQMLRNHGMSMPSEKRHTLNKVTFESYPVIGFNFRMSDIQAAVGVEQMKKLPKILEKRAQLAKGYTKTFQKSKYIIPPFVPQNCKYNWQSYVVRLKQNSRISRNGLMEKLLSAGVATRRGVMAIHTEPAYRKLYGEISLPATEEATQQTITLPLYSQMTRAEQNYVVDKVLQYTEG